MGRGTISGRTVPLYVLIVLSVVVAGVAAKTAWETPTTAEAQPAGGDVQQVEVTRVVDGDTIEVSPQVQGTEDVRLIGVDTPETVAPGQPVEPCGPEASDFTRERLEGQQVDLEFDEEKTDRYGRALAYVFVGDELFNETLVREGYAEVATFPPNVRYEERFLAAEEEARAGRVALWDPAGPCANSAPAKDEEATQRTDEEPAAGQTQEVREGVTIINIPGKPLPATGGDPAGLFAVWASVVLGVCLIALALRRPRSQR